MTCPNTGWGEKSKNDNRVDSFIWPLHRSMDFRIVLLKYLPLFVSVCTQYCLILMPYSFMEDARQSFTTLQLCMF
jgi:hypothetical protein